jgi:hypothetical protein
MLRKVTVLVLALAGTMAIGVTGASAKSFKATANIQNENGSCGANLEEKEVLGTVKFVRKGNTVAVMAKLKKGIASTTYGIDIANGACELLGRAGEFTTNKKGVGHGKGELTVPEGDTEFFADVDYTGFSGPFAPDQGDTPIVSLP